MPDITITSEWQSVSTLSGIVAGTVMKIQNKGASRFYAVESATQPLASSTEGEVVSSLEDEEPSKILTAGSGEVWVKVVNDNPTTAFVQDIS